MSVGLRRALLLVGLLGTLAIFAWGVLGAPDVGDYKGPYGDVLDRVVVGERHATDIVTAINFDYRGIDTLGEETILFTSVMGVVLLLRKRRKEEPRPYLLVREDHARERDPTAPSNAVRLLCLALVGITVVFGVYVVAHGQLSPGGGFQGGVILATVPLFTYLSGDLRLFHKIAPREAVDIAESLAVAGFIAVGLIGMAKHMPFLANVLPLGRIGTVASSGTIALISIITGVEVAAGFVVLLSAFLSELLDRAPKRAESSS